MRKARPFGLTLSTESARDIARAAITSPRNTGVALVVTPNIDHIATIRRSPLLARAYRNAARIVCDGWPVQAYARWCGHPVERVTGCEIAAELMRMAPDATSQRLFFVVDSAETEQAVRVWANRTNVTCATAVPPFGFERDTAYCARLAGTIRDFATTILLMAVGAPRSEIFVDCHRDTLPPCWAFCVGQAVKVELGLTRRASPAWQSARMEWLWRLLQEPSRLGRRYLTASLGFALAIMEDQRHNPREHQP